MDNKHGLKTEYAFVHAGIFTDHFAEFIEELCKDYGFVISLEQVERALQSVQNLFDAEDVLYTTQAAFCRTKEESDDYLALFCQKFLGYDKKPVAVQRKDKSIPPTAPRMTREEIQKKMQARAAELRLMNEDNDDEAEEAATELMRLRGKLQEAEKNGKQIERQYESAKAEFVKSSPMGASLDDIKIQIEKIKKKIPNGNLGNYMINEIVMDMVLKKGTTSGIADMMRAAMAAAVLARNDGDKELYAMFTELSRQIQELRDAKKSANLKLAKQEEIKKLQGKIQDNNRQVEAYVEEIEKRKETLQKKEELHQQAHRARNAIESLKGELLKWDDYDRYIEESKKEKLIIKEKSQNHRDIFIGGRNAVQTQKRTDEILNKEIDRLTAEDVSAISTYIASNARVFRQTLRRQYAAGHKCNVDVQATIQQSARTDGEIGKILYKRPKKSKARVVMLADISGSCRNVTSLALTYMGLMGDAFPGGCHQFVFINSLLQVDRYFTENAVDEAVRKINASVPSVGVYSDYGTPIASLVSDYSGYLTKDTTVIMIGDCRGNRRYNAADRMEWMCKRTHKVIILNPEKKWQWNRGDSTVGEYMACGAEVYPLESTKDLLEFLTAEK